MAKDNPDVFGYVYLLTNTVNGKVYVGQTVQSLRTRFNEHCSSRDKTHIHNAIRKYGKKAFTMSLLATAFHAEELDQLETEYIAAYNSTDRSKGYNICTGGYGTRGYVFTAEDRKKVGLAARRMWADPETRARIEAAHQARWTDDERKAQSERIRKFSNDPEYIELHRKNTTALFQTEEYRRNQSEGTKRALAKPEAKAKMSARTHRGWNDPETRARWTASRKAMWQDPDFRERVLASRKKTNERKRQERLAEKQRLEEVEISVVQ